MSDFFVAYRILEETFLLFSLGFCCCFIVFFFSAYIRQNIAKHCETLCELLYCQLSVNYFSLLILRSSLLAYVYLHPCSLRLSDNCFCLVYMCQALCSHHILCLM